MVVDASPGLGEAVVSGLVTPDHFRLRKHWWGREVVERRRGSAKASSDARGRVEARERVRCSAPGMALRIATCGGLRVSARRSSATSGRRRTSSGPRPAARRSMLQARPMTALPRRSQTRPSRWRHSGRPGERDAADATLPARSVDVGDGPAVSELLGEMFGLVGLAVRSDRSFVERGRRAGAVHGRIPVRPTPAPAAGARSRASPGADGSTRRAGRPIRCIEEARRRAASWRRATCGASRGQELLATVREALAIPRLLGRCASATCRDRCSRLARPAPLLGLLGRADRFDALAFGAGDPDDGVEPRRSRRWQRGSGPMRPWPTHSPATSPPSCGRARGAAQRAGVPGGAAEPSWTNTATARRAARCWSRSRPGRTRLKSCSACCADWPARRSAAAARRRHWRRCGTRSWATRCCGCRHCGPHSWRCLAGRAASRSSARTPASPPR